MGATLGAIMANPFTGFFTFLWAVAAHVNTLVAGCVVTFMIGILEKYVWKKPISLKGEVAVLIAFVFFACFQAWRDQYRKVSQTPSQPAIQVNVPPITVPPAQVTVVSSQSPPKATVKATADKPKEITISNATLELRLICSLRDPMKMPEDIALGVPSEPQGRYLEGSIGKSYLRPLTSVQYKRTEEEGKVSMIFRYELPENSDLIGRPISRLTSYDKLAINAWGADGNYFRECSFLEATFSVDGEEVYKTSESFQTTLQPARSVTPVLWFRHLKLPQ